jgi:Uma2 family endonuclease
MTLMVESRNPVLMHGVSWDFYSRMLQEIGPSRSTRVTYDNGRMEIVTSSNLHERVSSTISWMIGKYASAADIDVTPDGRLTLRDEAKKLGLEPDECFYVAMEAPPASEGEFDLSVNPPPNLVVEVEISRGTIPKQPIYAALGIREIWRFNGQSIESLHLGEDGTYRVGERSLAFPSLPLAEFSRFVLSAVYGSHPKAMREYGAWLRTLKG